jgi:hypothetical protein
VRDDELSTVQRGWVLTAVRALGAAAEAACARRWPEAPAVARHARALFMEPMRLSAEGRRLDAPIPAGLERVHPSWYEPPPASARPEAAAWLQRKAYAHLVELPETATGDDPAARLERLDGGVLEGLLERLGRRRVATAFSGATHAQLAQLCARLGEPAASALLADVRQVASQTTREEVKAEQRALFSLGFDPAGDTPRMLFVRVGAARLAPPLAARGGDRLRRVAQRLPRPAGRLLLAAGHLPHLRMTDAENAATWALVGLWL